MFLFIYIQPGAETATMDFAQNIERRSVKMHPGRYLALRFFVSQNKASHSLIPAMAFVWENIYRCLNTFSLSTVS
jgi:hypothetical protein